MEEMQAYKTWDIKKIFVLLVILVVLALGFKIFVLDKNKSNVSSTVKNVEGVSVEQSPSPSPVISQEIKRGVELKLNELKKEVSNINVVEIASSSPAVQKVLNDIKNLQSLPQTQAKEACLKICSGL